MPSMLEHIYITQKGINRRLLELELGLGFALELGLELVLRLRNWRRSRTKGRINTLLVTAQGTLILGNMLKAESRTAKRNSFLAQSSLVSPSGTAGTTKERLRRPSTRR